jgi:hypothetical protein
MSKLLLIVFASFLLFTSCDNSTEPVEKLPELSKCKNIGYGKTSKTLYYINDSDRIYLNQQFNDIFGTYSFINYDVDSVYFTLRNNSNSEEIRLTQKYFRNIPLQKQENGYFKEIKHIEYFYLDGVKLILEMTYGVEYFYDINNNQKAIVSFSNIKIDGDGNWAERVNVLKKYFDEYNYSFTINYINGYCKD